MQVCGTVAGHRAENGNTESTGMADGIAKDAKLAIFDIGNSRKRLLRLSASFIELQRNVSTFVIHPFPSFFFLQVDRLFYHW